MPTGTKIKEIRKRKGLTQKQLGDLCGIADANIRKYENGKQNPKIETLQKIADALGVSIIDLTDNISISEYKQTDEYKSALQAQDTLNSVAMILKAIYGNFETKYVEEEWGACLYYLVGTGENSFILHDGVLETIYEYMQSSIPFVIEGLKDTRPEKDVIETFKKDLNNPDLLKEIKRISELE